MNVPMLVITLDVEEQDVETTDRSCENAGVWVVALTIVDDILVEPERGGGANVQ